MTIDDQITAAVTRGVAAALRAARTDEHVSDDGQLLVSYAEAARRLDVSPDTIRQMVHLGDLDKVEGIGRGGKVTVESLHRWVQGHTTNAITDRPWPRSVPA